jgi:hypothetical protein
MDKKARARWREELEASEGIWKHIVIELIDDLEKAEGLAIRLGDELSSCAQEERKRNQAIIRDLRLRVEELENELQQYRQTVLQ